jgi:hypothetical protein
MAGLWQRQRRIIIAVAAVLLVVGAVLLWGPIGLGNGPLAANTGGIIGWTASGSGPVAVRVHLINHGQAQATIDSVDFAGGTRYPAPRASGADGFRGRSIPRSSWRSIAAIRVSGPPPGYCWVITKIVIHYHVGIRHYAASDPFALAVCAKTASGQMLAAIHAAEGIA